jgi:hypothetical protein
MNSTTKPRQETTVGQVALGFVVVGRESFNGQKMSIEFAFGRAWRQSSYSSRFPAVRADIERNSLLGIIDRSPGRRTSHLAGWAGQWAFLPYVAEGWEPEEVADVLAHDGGVSLEGWRQLAQAFLNHLDGTWPAAR